jgi:hypothetical protein
MKGIPRTAAIYSGAREKGQAEARPRDKTADEWIWFSKRYLAALAVRPLKATVRRDL